MELPRRFCSKPLCKSRFHARCSFLYNLEQRLLYFARGRVENKLCTKTALLATTYLHLSARQRKWFRIKEMGNIFLPIQFKVSNIVLWFASHRRVFCPLTKGLNMPTMPCTTVSCQVSCYVNNVSDVRVIFGAGNVVWKLFNLSC